MPEDIPAVEDIKFARKRLEELEAQDNETISSFSKQLAEKLEAQEILKYEKLPDNIQILEALAKIIKSNPGERILFFGEKKFRLSSEGIRLVKEAMH